MTAPAPVLAAVTSQSVHVPDLDPGASQGALPLVLAGLEPGPACPPERAHELLGRKGLLGKDDATRLALCAVHRALGLPPRSGRASGPADPRTAVVASSNLGNLASVLGVVRAVRAGGRREVSPLAAPNASSNVMASTVAIWFRFGGPNLMVCSGATAGLDSVALGMLLLAAGRADRVVVVGAEPADPDAVAFHQLRGVADPLRAVAACVILEPASAGVAAPVIGRVSDRFEQPRAAGGNLLVLGREGQCDQPVDVSGSWGDMYGAQGVALVALAASLASSPAGMRGASAPVAIRVVCGDAADGWRTAEVAAPLPSRSRDVTTAEPKEGRGAQP
jgi:3-oxoacyl-[acyl-carrier-protein] synthase II